LPALRMPTTYTTPGRSPGWRPTGAAETVGALLLFSRRTTTLGALVLLPVLSNVVMLSLAYDAPVKLLSSQLLLMTGLLLLPEVTRLVDFSVLHRPTTPLEIQWRNSPPMG